MIVRRNLKLSIILKGSWRIQLFWLCLSGLVYVLFFHFKIRAIALPFAPVAVMGTALSIFLGFRNSSSYERWWEARKIWGGIINNSRNFARQIISLSSNKTEVTPEEIVSLHRELIYRQLAWINALRLQLRQQNDVGLWKNDVYKFISEQEKERLNDARNKATQLMLTQAKRISSANEKNVYDDFRHVQLDNTLNEFYNLQGQCERIKNTPLARQYDYFNRIFMHLFVMLMPLSLLTTFETSGLPILVIPFTMLIGFVFYVVEGVGRRIEDPFENKITDTPMTAICRTIEIDLRQMLNEKEIPAKLEPVDGFLF